MPEMHLSQPGFTNSDCGPFTNNKEQIQKLKKKKTGDPRNTYPNELDKACFQHDFVYRDFKDLARRQLLINHYILLIKPNMMNTKEILLHWFTNFSIKMPLRLTDGQELNLKISN